MQGALHFGVRRFGVSALLFAAATAALLCVPGGASAAGPPLPAWTNPVVAGDFPDPGAIYDGGQFWVATTASPAGLFPVLRSGDLRTWTLTGAAFPTGPAWAAGSYWAPALTRVGDRVLMFYSARARTGRHCVAVAAAPTPAGPYTDAGPLVCQARGSIDPAVAVVGNAAGCCGRRTRTRSGCRLRSGPSRSRRTASTSTDTGACSCATRAAGRARSSRRPS